MTQYSIAAIVVIFIYLVIIKEINPYNLHNR